MLGADHPDTLTTANNLASSLSHQGKHAEAEEMQREVLAVLGAKHPRTLTTAHNLASSLFSHGKHAEAEEMEREVLAVRKRVLGADHFDTLAAASDLQQHLSRQGTLAAASDLQQHLSRQGKHAEEEGLKGARGTEGQAGAMEEEAEAPVAEGAESEVQATQKRAAEGSGACADASKRRKQ